MPTTGVSKQPYPNASAVPDVPADLLLLAQRVDLFAGTAQVANSSERAALVTNSNVFEGMLVVQRDTGETYRYSSAAWKLWHRPINTDTASLSNITLGTGGTANITWGVSAGSASGFVDILYGSGSPVQGSTSRVAFPVAPLASVIATGDMPVGQGFQFDTSATKQFALFTTARSDGMWLQRSFAASSTNYFELDLVSGSGPVAVAVGDRVRFNFTYPIA